MTAAPQPASRESVPAWIARLAAIGWRLLVVVALALVFGFVAVELSTVTAAVIVGAIAASMLEPMARRLRERGLSSGIASAVACVIGLGALFLIIAFLALALVPSIGEIVSAVREGVDDVRAQLTALGVPPFVSASFDQLVESIVSVDVPSLVGSVASVATVLILGGFLTIFLLADSERGWASLMRGLDRRRARLLTVSVAVGRDRVGGFLRRTALLAVVDAVTVGLVLVVLGVPLAGPLVAATFILGFIPYVGGLVTALAVGLVVLASAGAAASVIALVAFVSVGIVAQRAIEGTSIGSRVDVHPVIVLAAIPAGAALFGLLGIVALLPMTVFLLVVGRSVVLALSMGSSGGAAPPPGVPIWLDRLAQWSWRGLIVTGVVAVLIAGMVRVPIVVIPAVLAAVLAATLAGPVARLRAAGWPSGRAALVATAATTILIAAAFVASIVWTAGPLADIVRVAVDGADELSLPWLADVVDDIGSELVIDLRGAVRGVAVVALNLVLALMLAYFFLRDGPGWWRRSLARLDEGQRQRVGAAGGHAVEVLGGYVTGTAIISLFGAVTSALIMVVLGLPLALPVGIFTFFGGFIPYLGSFLATAMATLIAIAVGTTSDVIVMLIFTVIFNIIQGNFVTPLVYGRTFSLHPAIILLAIPAGYEIAGILGMFVVIPFIAIVAATWRTLLSTIVADRVEEPISPEPGAQPAPSRA